MASKKWEINNDGTKLRVTDRQTAPVNENINLIQR